MTDLTEVLPSANRVVFDQTFTQDAFNDLPPFMRQKENIAKLLVMLVNRWDVVQTETIKLAYMTLLDNAEGKFLRDIAERMFITVGDQSDSQLKAYIKFKALKQDSEGTRSDIVNLLKLVSGGDYINIYKGINNFVEVTFPTECLALEQVGAELEDIFPVNTNLLLNSVITGTKGFGVGWYDENTNSTSVSDKIGVLGWEGLAADNNTGYAASIILKS